MTYKYSDYQKIRFDYSGMKGVGVIRGVSTIELPLIGVTYMIEVISSNLNIPNEEYPFRVIGLPEIGIKAFDEKESS